MGIRAYENKKEAEFHLSDFCSSRKFNLHIKECKN